MEIPKTTGFVLRSHPVTETSLVVTWLTRDFGKLRTVAKGARRPKSPFRGKLEPFYFNELLFLRSRRSDLHILHECSVIEPHRRLRDDFAKTMVATYFCELADMAIEPEHAEDRLFELFQATFSHLHTNPLQPLLTRHFEVNLLAALGFDPGHIKGRQPPDLIKLLQQLRVLRLDQLGRLKLTAQQEAALDVFFLGQAEQHFGRLPRSRRFVKWGWHPA